MHHVTVCHDVLLAFQTPLAGILGTLLAGVFCSTQLGIFSGNGFSDGIGSIGGQLAVQATGVVSTLVYTAVVTYVLLKLVGALVGLRVDDEFQPAAMTFLIGQMSL